MPHTPTGERPNPDELLERIKIEEARIARGRLRIFFGFAPGVGKTYRMLQVTRELLERDKFEPGEVLVGVVETHGRYDTKTLLLGLDLLARKKYTHRNKQLEEFDIDEALKRKPKLVLVDELAHTNAPGSRHPKRWQDVEELLSAGIDVFTTLNVQHVESLNDVVAQITNVQVRETVPDSVLNEATAIELVDITPEELLQRLEEGKVYLPEQAKRATEHFFKRGNLLALRELALRRTAQRVDEDVLEYRDAHGVSEAWPTNERILVCVGAGSTAGRLVRSAARMAARLRCPWIACYVDITTVAALSPADRERVEAHLQAAEALGGAVARLSGTSLAETLLAYARKQNVTRIVIGKPTRSRLRDRIRGSLLDKVVQGSDTIDVHIISEDPTGDVAPAPTSDISEGAHLRQYVHSTLLVGAVLAFAQVLHQSLHLPDLEMMFLLAVMLAAVWFGRGPAIWTAALGVACYDFFFVPPYHTFSVSDHRYILTFVMMFGVGFALSELALRIKRQEQDAQLREERTAVLYALTRDLAAVSEPSALASIAAKHVANIFDAKATVFGSTASETLFVLAAEPPGQTLDDKDKSVARWSLAHASIAGMGTDTLPGSGVLCTPLKASGHILGVLALTPPRDAPLTFDKRTFLDVLCQQLALALERSKLSDEAKQAALKANTEEMRSSLLSAVSHDLRTPLATITGAATTLRDSQELSAATRRELVESVVGEAARLERLVANLLDMTRIEAGAIVLKRDWIPLDEMVGSALTRLESSLGAREVAVNIGDDVPLVYVDPVLFEQVFVNLFENSHRYAGADATIQVLATRHGDSVTIEVTDTGVGFPTGQEQKLFEKFVRGDAGSTGAGLGLAICKGIVLAHGGSISASNRLPHGAAIVLSIPIGGTPPSTEAFSR